MLNWDLQFDIIAITITITLNLNLEHYSTSI